MILQGVLRGYKGKKRELLFNCPLGLLEERGTGPFTKIQRSRSWRMGKEILIFKHRTSQGITSKRCEGAAGRGTSPSTGGKKRSSWGLPKISRNE